MSQAAKRETIVVYIHCLLVSPKFAHCF